LFDVAKFTTLTPLSLLISCKLSFLTVGLKISSLPTFVFNSTGNDEETAMAILRYHNIYPEEQRKIKQHSVRTASPQVKIQNQGLTNTKQEC
jgi:hypothetical protein